MWTDVVCWFCTCAVCVYAKERPQNQPTTIMTTICFFTSLSPFEINSQNSRWWLSIFHQLKNLFIFSILVKIRFRITITFHMFTGYYYFNSLDILCVYLLIIIFIFFFFFTVVHFRFVVVYLGFSRLNFWFLYSNHFENNSFGKWNVQLLGWHNYYSLELFWLYVGLLLLLLLLW